MSEEPKTECASLQGVAQGTEDVLAKATYK